MFVDPARWETSRAREIKVRVTDDPITIGFSESRSFVRCADEVMSNLYRPN